MKTFILSIISLALLSSLRGQHYITQEFDSHLKSGKKDTIFHIRSDRPITGIVIRSEGNVDMADAFFISGNDTLLITPDEENDNSNIYTFSNLHTFSPAIDDFQFYPGKINNPIIFYFINASPSEIAPARVKKKVLFVRNQK